MGITLANITISGFIDIESVFVPTAPTIGTAARVSGSGTEIDVPYTASANNGGRVITSYTAVSNPGNITGTISQASSGTIRVGGLTQGTAYTFVVYATNGVGNSPNSAASNSIIPAIVPTAPTIGTPLNVSGSGTEIDVPYTASSSDGGLPITSYTATSTPGSITGTISQASSGTIRVSGLTQGTSYTFVVKATNVVGDSPNSAASSAITPGIVPSAPTIGTVIRVSGSGTSLDVPYTESASNGGLPITSYTATSTPGSLTGTISQASSGTIRVTGLTQGTNYTFVVKATSAVGNSPNSAASNSIAPAVIPNAPTIGTATQASAFSANITYTASSSNGGNAITSYTAVSTPGNITGTISQASSGTITVTGLTQGTSYTFVVYATNSLGNSPNSAASNSLTLVPTIPTAPTIGNASVANSTSVIVTYTASSSNGGNAITSYTAVSTPGNITGTISQASSGTITVTGLTQGTSYTFVVYATNSLGNSPNSAASNSITPIPIPDAPIITSVQGVSGSNTSIQVNFSAPTSNGGSPITSYTATFQGNPTSTATVNQANGGNIVLTGLVSGASYGNVYMIATNSTGNSLPSANTANIFVGNLPNAPTIGTASINTNTSAYINYTSPSPSANSIPIRSFTAISTPGNLTGTINQAASGTIRVNGLTAGIPYTFSVYATNDMGNSVNSSPSNSVTPYNKPGQASIGNYNEGVTLSTVTQPLVGVIKVPFTAPSNGGTPITSHVAVSTPGNITASVNQASSGDIYYYNPNFVRNGSYVFRVYAVNNVGTGQLSAVSNQITYQGNPSNENLYSTTGTFTWIAPTGVSSVSAVAVGGGGSGTPENSNGTIGGSGGGGGGLGWRNNISVTSGNSYSVVVGAVGSYGPPTTSGGNSYFINTSTVFGGGGNTALSPSGGLVSGGTYVGGGGGNGGNGGATNPVRSGTGGGGAGGYSGAGGNGGNGNGSASGGGGEAGQGGAGAGGAAGETNFGGVGGGGVGIYGEGPSGAAPTHAYDNAQGGSGGQIGRYGGIWNAGTGGFFGGGGGGAGKHSSYGIGGLGGVRVIWGTGRSFPSTNVSVQYDPTNLPLTPTVGTVTTSTGQISVPFTAANANGGTITSHVAISTPGNVLASINQASSGTIIYTNDYRLTANTAYTFKVYAVNEAGAGPQSTASNSITYGGANAQIEYTTAGTYTWVAPEGVTSVSVVAVGAGGYRSTEPVFVYNVGYGGVGGGGGGLGYKNNIAVIPNNSYTVVVGATGSDTYFANTTTVVGGAGGNGWFETNREYYIAYAGTGGSFVGDGGGYGGNGGFWVNSTSSNSGSGGGGAGGYSGNGGTGGTAMGGLGSNGAGGGAGGGGGGSNGGGGGGGGVGIYGQGANGAGGSSNPYPAGGGGGTGGSNGANGTNATSFTEAGNGGAYGGGSGGAYGGAGVPVNPNPSGGGAVRIIWGTGRSFPSTNTANTTR